MSTHTSLEALQAQVFGLSKVDRARLLERLVVSLDVDIGAEGVPLEEAMARLRARFPL